MSTKPQQFVAVAALLALGATSCSSAPEPRSESARVPAQEQRTAANDSGSNPAAVPAAPAGESRSRVRTTLGGAVIHERQADLVLPEMRDGNMAALTSLRDAADSAVSTFRYQRAVEIFRTLRDHEDTPKTMRAEFHASMNESADIAFGLHEVRRDLDRQDFTRASRRVELLSKKFPEVPFAMLVQAKAPQVQPVVPGVVK